MPGIALHFADASVDDHHGLHLYYNTTIGTLGLEQHDRVPGEKRIESFSTDASDRPGSIVSKSNLAAATMLGIPVVFATTLTKEATPTNDPTTQFNVSIVAPFQKTLTKVEKTALGLAACNSKNKAWLYHMEGVDKTSSELIETVLDGAASTDVGSDYSVRLKEVNPDTRIAAFWVPEEKARYVVVQGGPGKDNQLACVTLGTLGNSEDGTMAIRNVKADVEPLETTAPVAKRGTSIAATWAGERAWVYFLNTDNKLYWTSRKHGEKWTPADNITGINNAIDPDTQLAVVSSEGVNHIFFKWKRGGFTHVNHPHDLTVPPTCAGQSS
jgi:hypothetical protein